MDSETKEFFLKNGPQPKNIGKVMEIQTAQAAER
jgi:hypothetical protein